jgi:hypothetical protein
VEGSRGVRAEITGTYFTREKASLPLGLRFDFIRWITLVWEPTVLSFPQIRLVLKNALSPYDIKNTESMFNNDIALVNSLAKQQRSK